MISSPPLSAPEIQVFFEILSHLNPFPRGELTCTSPFTLLVAVVLSAQATDKSVNKVTPFLFEQAKTPQEMLTLGEDKLREIIKSIGFANTKARHIMALSQQLLQNFDGEVPHTRAALMSLPGVGGKTASVVLNIAFQHPTIAVDTHVFRVSNRTGLAAGRTPDQVEQVLMARVPHAYQLNAHHWLILHGRYICKALKPLCGACPVAHVCQYPDKKRGNVA